jgi:hypothetical protein
MAVASASAFHFWLSKTFRQIWRTVRQKKMDYKVYALISVFKTRWQIWG